MSTDSPEQALIPFERADLLGQRVLVIAPHPDDETFGCGGCLALHRAHGDPVMVVFLTSGEAGDWSGERSPEQTRMTREAEAGRALAELGVDAWEFWRYADRGVAVDGELVERLTDAIGRLGPTLIYAPAPVDLHPDHRAAARALRAAARGCELTIAFFEIAVPVPVNALVDVSGVWPAKARAMRAYPSQLAAQHDYEGVVTGLARFRSLTIDGATHVEALRLVDAGALDGDPVWRSAALQGPTAPAGAPAVSVILRTRDRPDQLASALDSLTEQTLRDFEVVVVNDGGADVASVLADRPTLAIRHVRPAARLGRSAAVNAGVELARGRFIAHLDDDDVYYPGHLQALHDVLVANSGFGAAYTDVDVARFGWDATTGTYQLMSRLPEYAREFDADCLLYENYIPNLAVMHTREAWDRVGGFDDAEVDLLGDWDFLVRLAHEVRFVHVARRTAEVRVYEGGSLSVLRGWGQPDELRIREAMFHRHRDRYAPEVQLRVFHEFKRRTLDAEQRLGQHAARSAELARELTQVQEELAGARAAHGYQVQQLEQQAVQLEEQTRQREQQTHKLEVQTHQREQQTHQLEEQAHQLEQQTLQLEHQALQLEQQALQLDRQASQLEHRADQLAQQAVEPEPLAAPESEPLAPASNGGAPTPTTAQRRRVAMARVASCVRDPARATRWARVALEDPALALARLRGRR